MGSPARELLLAVACCTRLIAQCPPAPPVSVDLTTRTAIPTPGGAADIRWQAAKQALTAGKRDEAQKHLLAALEFHPSSPPLLLDFVRTVADDPDLLAVWCNRFVAAAADAQGRLKLDAPTRKLLPAGKPAETLLADTQKLPPLRAAALVELTRASERWKPVQKQPNGARAVLVRYVAELVERLGRHAPAALGAAAPALDRTMAGFADEHEQVVQALLRVLRTTAKADAPAPGTAAPTRDQVVRAARILLGLAKQAGFKDLQGPAPRDLHDVAAEAQATLGALAAAKADQAKVWTVAELEQLGPEAAVAFTAAHRSWDDPGIATSPNGRYRIETVCGYTTLLGAAKTVELHHARLVAHYGADPFLERQGTIRIVPESSDLETEGAPFWWAAGFQAGDRTTFRFAWGNLPGLGHGLTHELTHRFDGVLRPFLGSWFGEGHASWTGGHYTRAADPTFREDQLDLGSVLRTANKGYGGREKLEKLLRGDLEDYRDNYFAGYTLYAFLRSYPPGAPRYREALERFEKNGRAGQKDPIGWFTSNFADGRQGRPNGIDAFVADWQGFLRGVAEWLDDKPKGNEWVGRYKGGEDHDPKELVLDEPTFSWARSRAEPFFGQDHAAAATQLLHELGDHDATIAAGLWSLQVDGWRLATARAVATALAVRSPEAAWAFGAIAAQRFPELAPSGTAPWLAGWKAVATCADALAARSRALAAAGATVAAGELAAEHLALAHLLGQPGDATVAAAAPPPPPENLGVDGLEESSLTGFDDHRVPGLWYAGAEGDLHVGREKPRAATGSLDRASHQRDAFVHAVAWIPPGRYVVRARVYLTTAYVSGAIVFGHTRRDRDLRVGFSAGDFRYAIGKDEQNRRAGKLHTDLSGLSERDGQLPDTHPGQDVDLPAGQNWFDIALWVDGPRVLVEVQGEPVAAYAVHDSAPIEGQVGFATGMGAIRVVQPTVQRLDAAGGNASGLDPRRPETRPIEDLLHLPTAGLPHASGGTLVLWLPRVADGSPAEELPKALPVLAKLLHTEHEHPQQWLLAVPKELPAAERTAVAERLTEFRKTPLPVVEHDVGAPFRGPSPWVLFLDDLGVLRAASEVGDPKLLTRVLPWSRLFRSR